MNVSKGSKLGEGCFQDCNNTTFVKFKVNDNASLQLESSVFKLCCQLCEVTLILIHLIQIQSILVHMFSVNAKIFYISNFHRKVTLILAMDVLNAVMN